MNDAPHEPETTPGTTPTPPPSADENTGNHPTGTGDGSVPFTPSVTEPTSAAPAAARPEPTAAPAATGATASSFAAEPTPATSAPRRRAGAATVVAALAVGALIGGVSGAGVGIWATSSQNDKVATPAGPSSITVNDSANVTAITAVAAKASPSVVTISVTGTGEGGTGSGIVLNDKGYILTNTHVVTLDGAEADPKVRVETSDGRLLDATVVGTDPIVDLAVIKVDPSAGLPAAEFADSSELNVGDTAIAIGAPLGLAGTVTNGIISALNRSITVASSAAPDSSADQAPDTNGQDSPFDFWLPGQGNTQNRASSTISLSVIQTDAAINPGNSGGALLDSNGRVIGVNVAIASAGSGSGTSGSIGVGFAIPSNVAQRVAKEIIDSGSATHGLLGAAILDVTEDQSQTAATTVGASITDIVSGGAAEAGGLKVGDIITSVNGLPITGKTDLTAQIRVLPAGAKADIGYVRSGKAATSTVTLGELK